MRGIEGPGPAQGEGVLMVPFLWLLVIIAGPTIYVVVRCRDWGREVFWETKGPTPDIRRHVALLRVAFCVVPFALLTVVSLLVAAGKRAGTDDNSFLWGVGIVVGLAVLLVVGPAFAYGVQAGYKAEVKRRSESEARAAGENAPRDVTQ